MRFHPKRGSKINITATSCMEFFIDRIPLRLKAKLDSLLRACYMSKGYVIVPALQNGFLGDSYGLKYVLHSQLDTLGDIKDDYSFDNILKTDVVLDIGANIGGFSLPASQKARVVYAVEPLYADVLKRNIALNDIENVTVFDCGIGLDTRETISYGERKKEVFCASMRDILDCIGGCDFLKIDCEGAEWTLTVDDLKKVRRRIEGELHISHGEDESLFWDRLCSAGFDFNIVVKRRLATRLFHAYKPLSSPKQKEKMLE